MSRLYGLDDEDDPDWVLTVAMVAFTSLCLVAQVGC